MRFAILTAYMAVATPTHIAVQPDIEPPGSLLKSQAGRDLCYTVREWKGLMRRQYPKHDRSIPSMARLCAMRDD
jgi:hypothetical protein